MVLIDDMLETDMSMMGVPVYPFHIMASLGKSTLISLGTPWVPKLLGTSQLHLLLRRFRLSFDAVTHLRPAQLRPVLRSDAGFRCIRCCGLLLGAADEMGRVVVPTGQGALADANVWVDLRNVQSELTKGVVEKDCFISSHMVSRK